MNTSSVRGAPPPLANHGNNNGNAAVAVAAPAASAAAQTTNTAPPTGCTVDTSQLGLLQTLTRERQDRSTDLAQHRSLLQSLNRGLSAALTDNAALRRMPGSRGGAGGVDDRIGAAKKHDGRVRHGTSESIQQAETLFPWWCLA